ncbi:DUF6629 family protein [Streptomyces sp. NPDC060048]|uniref:DUF6629 family protein n=1 Tax=unclassified Streptomyces TaxID=2593676 RepID=UPI0036B8BA8E
MSRRTRPADLRRPPLRLLGLPPTAGVPVCAALWRLESASTWCAFAAVTSTPMLVWTGHRGGSPSERADAGRRAPGL